MMSKTCKDLLREFPQYLDSCMANESATFSEIAAAERAGPRSLVFASNKKFLESALSGQASVVITSNKIWNDSLNAGNKGILLSSNVSLAQAAISTALTPRFPPRTKTIHPTAFISESAKLGRDVTVGAFAFIGDHCTVGDRAYVGPHSVLEESSVVGSDTILWAQAYLGNKCRIGNECVLHPQVVIGSEGFGFAPNKEGRHFRIPHNGIVVVEDRVEIGAQCAIDRAVFEVTRIGQGTKFDNLVHIAHNCQVGHDCLLIGGTMLGGSSQLGNNVVIGGGTFVTDHAKVTNNVSIGGLSGVTNDINEPGLYGGYPIQPLKDYLRTTATMVHLVEMRKNINDLLKAVFGKS
jgi:UDP-3-O-[3-hydroxymyristoyl] glucosamine N-acyltransferase